MAVVTTKSTILTNTESAGTSTETKNSPKNVGGRVRMKKAFVAVAAGDDDNSVYRFFRVKSSDSILSIQCYCTAVTGGTDYDCGLYGISGGAVVDADLYADGFSVATAAPAVPPTAAGSSPIELRYGDASTAIPSDVNQTVWQDLGLSSDPGLEYDVALTANTVGTGAGEIALVMYYVAGD